MKAVFRIKGTPEILTPRLTEDGTVVLIQDNRFYIDEYFPSGNEVIPDLEISVDGGKIWWDSEDIRHEQPPPDEFNT